MGFYLRLEKLALGWNQLKAFDAEVLRFVPSTGQVYMLSLRSKAAGGAVFGWHGLTQQDGSEQATD